MSETAATRDRFEESILGVLFPDCPHCGRGCEQGVGLVLLDDAPECARVGGAHGFPFEEDRRGPDEERRVEDVRVSDDPSDI